MTAIKKYTATRGQFIPEERMCIVNTESKGYLFEDCLQPVPYGMRRYLTIPPEFLPLVNGMKDVSDTL